MGVRINRNDDTYTMKLKHTAIVCTTHEANDGNYSEFDLCTKAIYAVGVNNTIYTQARASLLKTRLPAWLVMRRNWLLTLIKVDNGRDDNDDNIDCKNLRYECGAGEHGDTE